MEMTLTPPISLDYRFDDHQSGAAASTLRPSFYSLEDNDQESERITSNPASTYNVSGHQEPLYKRLYRSWDSATRTAHYSGGAAECTSSSYNTMQLRAAACEVLSIGNSIKLSAAHDSIGTLVCSDGRLNKEVAPSPPSTSAASDSSCHYELDTVLDLLLQQAAASTASSCSLSLQDHVDEQGSLLTNGGEIAYTPTAVHDSTQRSDSYAYGGAAVEKEANNWPSSSAAAGGDHPMERVNEEGLSQILGFHDGHNQEFRRRSWVGPTLQEIESALQRMPSWRICSAAADFPDPASPRCPSSAAQVIEGTEPSPAYINLRDSKQGFLSVTFKEEDTQRRLQIRSSFNTMQPRYKVTIRSEEDYVVNSDGYKWHKYGQKSIKSKPYPRSYYKCSSAKCQVKKQVERRSVDTTLLTYEGIHLHYRP